MICLTSQLFELSRTLPGDARGEPCGDCPAVGDALGDDCPVVMLTVTVGDEPLPKAVMLTATIPGGGGGRLSCGDTCISNKLALTSTMCDR